MAIRAEAICPGTGDSAVRNRETLGKIEVLVKLQWGKAESKPTSQTEIRETDEYSLSCSTLASTKFFALHLQGVGLLGS